MESTAQSDGLLAAMFWETISVTGIYSAERAAGGLYSYSEVFCKNKKENELRSGSYRSK